MSSTERHRTAEVVGLLAGVVVFSLVLYGSAMLGYMWQRQHINDALHPAGWATRTGVVTGVGTVDYTMARPFRPDLVRYKDYQGYWHNVKIDMPIDGYKVGSRTTVYVRDDESIDLPESMDWVNQVSEFQPAPGGSYHGVWPKLAWFFGSILALVACGVTRAGTFNVVKSFAGRLGTR